MVHEDLMSSTADVSRSEPEPTQREQRAAVVRKAKPSMPQRKPPAVRRKGHKARGAPLAPLALSIKQFCETHSISNAYYYLLRDRGEGPVEMRVGTNGGRILISHEAAAAWRRRCEQPKKTTTDSVAEGQPEPH